MPVFNKPGETKKGKKDNTVKLTIRSQEKKMDMDEKKLVDGDLHLTEIPQQFMLAKTKNLLIGGAAHKVRSQSQQATRNQQYEKKLANNGAGRLVSRYRVPVNRPLPVRSLDIAQVSRKKNFNVESVLAPLFGGAAGDAAKVDFLVPAENNPRRMIEEKKKREERPRGSTEIKQRMNEPKHMPNLDKKVSKNFIPRCAMVSTRSLTSYTDKQNIVSKSAGKSELHLKDEKKKEKLYDEITL